jgi:uncharacterized membrane protein YvbJ
MAARDAARKAMEQAKGRRREAMKVKRDIFIYLFTTLLGIFIFVYAFTFRYQSSKELLEIDFWKCRLMGLNGSFSME